MFIEYSYFSVLFGGGGIRRTIYLLSQFAIIVSLRLSIIHFKFMLKIEFQLNFGGSYFVIIQVSVSNIECIFGNKEK